MMEEDGFSFMLRPLDGKDNDHRIYNGRSNVYFLNAFLKRY